MPATVADPNRSLDSEQISPATIAHHTVYENTPNLHQSHICQWGAQPYLVGPLSRLVGKLPLSPWVSADFLPLTQVVNNTNSAIPLTEIFDRVFSDVCNSLGFEVQKQKKRGSGNNRVYRNLNLFILKDVAWASKLSTHAKIISGHQRHVSARAKSVQCVCVCVFFPSILDIKFVGRTSRGHTGGRSHRIFHPPSFCGACLNFSREKDSAIPFPRRP